MVLRWIFPSGCHFSPLESYQSNMLQRMEVSLWKCDCALAGLDDKYPQGLLSFIYRFF